MARLSLAMRDAEPRYSINGASNKDLFLANKNAVLFYFEDEGCEEFYLRLVRKVFPGVDVNDVFCLGGKDKAKERLRESSGGKPRVFILDKDFVDLIGGEIDHPQVIYLNQYSIENYLLSEEGLLDVAVEHKRHMRKTVIAETLDFPGYFQSLFESYDPLCRLFVVCQKHHVPIETSKNKAKALIDEASCVVKADWLNVYRRKLIGRAGQNGLPVRDPVVLEEESARAYEVMAGFEGHANPLPFAHYCGKHLLFATLKYIDSKLDTDIADGEMFEAMMRLIEKVPNDQFALLRTRAIDVLSNQGLNLAV